MRFAGYVAVLALGFTLGFWAGRSDHKVSLVPASIAPVEPSSSKAISEAVSQNPPASVSPGPNLTSLKQDFEDLLLRGEMRQALLVLQDIEKWAPNSREYFEANGDYLSAQKDWSALKISSQKCVQIFPQLRACWRQLATAELQVGTKDEQASAVNTCLAQEPNDPQCRNMLGMVLMNAGDYSGAIAVYEQLIRDNGSYGTRFTDDHLEWQLGLALEGAGRREEAIDHFENACRRNLNQACQKIEELSGGGID